MVKARQTSKRGSGTKVLIVIPVLLLLIGGAVIDPLAGLVCFVLGGFISFTAVLSGTGWSRYIALALLVLFIALAIQKFPETGKHQRKYRSTTITGSFNAANFNIPFQT